MTEYCLHIWQCHNAEVTTTTNQTFYLKVGFYLKLTAAKESWEASSLDSHHVGPGWKLLQSDGAWNFPRPTFPFPMLPQRRVCISIATDCSEINFVQQWPA